MALTPIEAARRAQIIRGAIAAIARLGYARASLARIAELAGLRKSLITYHFPSKDALLEATFEAVVMDCWAHMEPAIARAPDSPARLAAYIGSQIDYMRRNRESLLAMGQIAINHRPADAASSLLNGFDSDEVALLSELFLAGQSEGSFRPFDTAVMAHTVARAVEGALSAWAFDPGLDLEAYGRELVVLFARATAADSVP